MNEAFSRPRRFCIAAASIAFSAFLFAPQIADGLVVRGDDFMYRNAPAEAMTRYERAISIDRGNAAATDRIAFVGMELRTPESLRRAVDVSTRYLAKRPDDGAILADRALCYLIQRRYALALIDFEHVARLERNPQFFVFAGWAADRANERRRARALWRKALAIDPYYLPARRALERSR
jgi:tetratricopeptide (TPR) repeat protein